MKNQPLAALLAYALSSGSSLAQSVTQPDAGSLRQQIEQSRREALPARAPEPVAPPQAPAVAPEAEATINVRSFRFEGNTLLGSDALAAVLSGYVNRPLKFADLTRATELVSDAYRAAGWLARTLLPEQNIDDGVLMIQVIEARFGGVRSEGARSLRVLPSEVEAYVLHQQPLGQALNLRALDRALLIADDLPGVSVAGTYEVGPGEGQSSLVLQTTDEPFIYGDVGTDNLGSRLTGSVRQTANLNVNSPGGRGELLSLNLLHTKGSNYGRVALTVPGSYSGLRVGVNASTLDYSVITGPGAASANPINGKSGSLGMEWNAPLVRERVSNLYFTGGLDAKTFFNQDTQVRGDYATHSLRMGLSGNRFDDLGGNGSTSGFVQMLWGHLGDIVVHPQDGRLAGRYRKLNYAVSRQQNLSGAHSLFVGLSGQQATQSLDSSEKYYVGGPSSVRAYPSSEISGERGEVLSAEWRWRLSPFVLLTAFVDHGRALALPSAGSQAASELRLTGRGLSADWQGPMGLSARLTWAHRNGDNPKPTANGTDSDGTLDRNRFWFSASLKF